VFGIALSFVVVLDCCTVLYQQAVVLFYFDLLGTSAGSLLPGPTYCLAPPFVSSLGTRPSENRKEGLGDRLYRAECMEFVIISSYPLYFWNF